MKNLLKIVLNKIKRWYRFQKQKEKVESRIQDRRISEVQKLIEHLEENNNFDLDIFYEGVDKINNEGDIMKECILQKFKKDNLFD